MEIGPERPIFRGCGHKRRLVAVRDSYYYVPLKKTLSCILSKNSLTLLNPEQPIYRSDEKLEYLLDGALFANHPLFINDARTIQLVLYSDEVELVNAIGNSVKKQTSCDILYFSQCSSRISKQIIKYSLCTQ